MRYVAFMALLAAVLATSISLLNDEPLRHVILSAFIGGSGITMFCIPFYLLGKY